MIRITLVALLLAVNVSATENDAVDVARQLPARVAGGDALAAAELFAPGKAREAFLLANSRRMLTRCMRVENVATRVIASGENRVEIEIDELVSVRSTYADAYERLESARSRVVVQRDGEAWRITEWKPQEEAFIDSVLAEQDAARRRELLAAPPMRTTRLVNVLVRRAVTLVNQRRLDQAAELIEAAASQEHAYGDVGLQSLVESARTVLSNNRLDRTVAERIQLSEGALALAEQSRDPDLISRALLRLGRARQYLYGGAAEREHFERIIAMNDALEDISIAALAATQMAQHYDHHGRHREAFIASQLAARYAHESGDITARASAELNLGGTYQKHADYELSSVHFARAAELGDQLGLLGTIAFSYAAMANNALELGHAEEGLRYVNEALARVTLFPNAHTEHCDLLMTRSQIYMRTGRLEEADRDIQTAFTLDNVAQDIAGRREVNRIALRVAQKRWDDALALLDATPHGLGARHLRGRVLNALGKYEEAATVLRTVTDEIEWTRGSLLAPDPRQRWMYFRAQLSIYLDLLDALVARNDVRGALAVAEQMKARVLRDALEHGHIDADVSLTPAERRQRDELDRRLSELNHKLMRMKGDAPERQATLDARDRVRSERIDLNVIVSSRSLAQRAQRSADLRLEDLPPSLRDVAIVDYVVGSERTVVFTVRVPREGEPELRLHVVPIKRADLTARVAELTSRIESRDLRYVAAAQKLYDLLLAPAEHVLRGARAICVIPDDELWRVPFHILRGPDDRPLLARAPVFYAPSIGVLVAAQSRRAEPRRRTDGPQLLAFANPQLSTEVVSRHRAVYRDAALSALPEAEDEVRAIGEIYGPTRSRIYTGAAARESVLKREAPGYPIMHVATHGILDDRSPMFSSLLLSADDGDDGFLEAREIARLQLDADLVVLAACDTARGGFGAGEGVIGLSWALLSAGCPTSVVSQWKASSAATSALMVRFHERVKAGLSPAEALRDAQLRLMRDRTYSHPFYWAPFVVLGAP